MKKRRLGKSPLTVTEICLGTMTFGDQCDEPTAHHILDQAYHHGINFYDTAEMYPVPPTAKKFGITEQILGRWLKTKPRDAILIATKITGPAHGWFTPPVRHGNTTLDPRQITLALEQSLKRLQTDYIDLYQTHWPDHGARQQDILQTLNKHIQQGKIRLIGASNETSWGIMKNLWTADKHNLQPFDTIQNNFSILNRRCQNELAQICRQEHISLLPYSPLGGGVLTGKYNNNQQPQGARFTQYLQQGKPRQQQMAQRFLNPRTLQTTQQCQTIAQQLGISPTTLAIAWSKQHDYVASTIIGISQPDQLPELLAAADLTLDQQTLQQIDQIEEQIPNPMPEDGLRRL